MPAFDSPSGIPFSDVNIGTGASHKPKWGSDSSTAEVTTVQLEFHRLTHITGDVRFSRAADRVSDKIAELSESVSPHHYLLPIFINAQSGKLSSSTISLGARGDSYYEYLLKQWIQEGPDSARGEVHKQRYIRAAEAINEHLILKSETPGADWTFLAEMTSSGKHSKKMDHLACFYAGVLALGSQQPGMERTMAERHLRLAEDLAKTCVEFYKRTPTGLAPEIIMFDCPGGQCKGGKKDFYIKPNDEHNLLRPETLESLFILWRITHKQQYRDWGWDIFLAFRKHCRVASGGYSSIKSVMRVPVEFRDKMESFWLAETLKYLYLLFSEDSIIPLDEYVLNTEAHPLPIKGRGYKK
jgi:mannosyl-oligosaccharide alpha-1,2-mannosidase